VLKVPARSWVSAAAVTMEKKGGNKIIILQDSQSYKKYSAEVRQPALLVVRGNYRSGWKAKIYGEKTDVFKVNLTSKGVFLPPGRHEVVIKYYPESFHFGMIISLVSLLLIICFLVVFLIKRKPVGGKGSPF